jgi:hypothetical protein
MIAAWTVELVLAMGEIVACGLPAVRVSPEIGGDK